MKREKAPPQTEFDIGMGNSFEAMPQSEKKYRIHRLITFSDIEKLIYKRHGIQSRDIIGRGLAVGSAIDYFLIPANFIYRYRSKYCFPDSDDPFDSWTMEDAFKKFYPTGYPSIKDEMLSLLEKHRRSFLGENNPLNPGKPVLEKRGIRERLFPLWVDVAKTFKVDALSLQRIMKKEEGGLVASEEAASSEGIMDIAQRIVSERFYSLIEDDKNYSYYAKPDFMIVYEFEGKTYHIQVQPDYIKRLREERPSVQKRIKKGEKLGKRIVAQRIVGDFKDTDKTELENGEGPFIEAMRLYYWLLSQVGQKGRLKTTWVRLLSGQEKNAYIIPLDATNLVSANKIEVVLTLLKAERGSMDIPMPKVIPITEEKAKKTLEQALRKSREVRI